MSLVQLLLHQYFLTACFLSFQVFGSMDEVVSNKPNITRHRLQEVQISALQGALSNRGVLKTRAQNITT